MKKTMRKVIASMLLIIMLFSICATTVAAAPQGTDDFDGDNIGSIHPFEKEEGNGTTSHSIDLGWCKIGYVIDENNGNSINVEWRHNLDAMLEATPEQLKKLTDVLREGVQNVLVESFKQNPSEGTEEPDGSLNTDNIWKEALDGFLNDKYNSNDDDAAVAFFEELFKDDGTLVNEFSDYACDLLKVAVQSGAFTLDDILAIAPDGDALKDKIGDELDNKVDSFAETYIGKEVDKYIDYLESGISEPLTDRVLIFVEGELVAYVKNQLDIYLEDGETKFNSQIETFIDREIKEVLNDVISNYLVAKETPGYYVSEPTKLFVFGKIDAYLKQAVKNYITAKFDGAGAVADADKTVLDGKFDAQIAEIIKDKISEEFDLVVAYIERGRVGAVPEYYSKFKDAYESEFTGTEFESVSAQNLRGNKDTILAGFDTRLTKSDYENLLVNDFDSAVVKLNKNNFVQDLIDGTDKTSIIDSVFAKLDKNDSEYKESVERVVGSMSNDQIVDIVRDALKEIDFDVEEIVDEIKGDFTIASTKLNDAIVEIFDLSDSSVVSSRIEYLKDTFADDYDETIKYLNENKDVDLTLEDVIKYLESVTVNGQVLVSAAGGSLSPNTDAVKALLEELPTPRELTEMKNSDMHWDWDVIIDVGFGEIEFNLSFAVTGNHGKLKDLVSKILDLVSVRKGTGEKLTLEINLFESMTKIFYDICNAPDTEISKDLKLKLFALTDGTVADVYDFFINDLEFSDFMAIIGAVDFRAILQEFGINSFTNERIVAIVGKEAYFNKLKSLLTKAYGKLPQTLKDLTLKELYNGEIFAYERDINISLSAILDNLPSRISAIVNTILRGKDITFDFTADFQINAPNINYVEFYVKDGDSAPQLMKTGFLPSNVDLEYFYGTDRYQGYKITQWSDSSGKKYTQMPNSDVQLYATVEKLEAVAEGDVSAIYSEDREYTLTARVITTLAPQYSYQWYKNDVLIPGATKASLKVKNVADSGEYYCKVGMIDASLDVELFTNKVTVSIQKKAIDINSLGITWDYKGPYTYDEETVRTVTPSTASDLIVLDTSKLQNTSKKDAGNYTAVAYYNIANSNYTFSGDGFVSLNWVIKKKPLKDDSKFDWDYKDKAPFVYSYGKSYTVSFDVTEELVVNYSGTSMASNAGNYTAVATISPANENYEWVGEKTQYELTWEVQKAEVDLSSVTWGYDTQNPFTYDGETHTVAVNNPCVDIVWLYENSSAVNAGTYTASAEPDPNVASNNNYAFKGKIPDCEWKINKATLATAVTGSWNYEESFVYTGEAHTVELVLNEALAEGLSLTYVNNSATDVGTYTATATIVALDADNFAVSGETLVYELNWAIDKATVDLSNVSLRSETINYDGKPHNIFIVGDIPADITVEYSPARTEPGTYEVVATFVYNENNYNPISPLTATLTILPVYEINNDFTLHGTDGELLINISAKNGIPSNHTLNMSDLTTSYANYDFGYTFGHGTAGKVYAAYDISFNVGGSPSPVEDVFTVRLAIPANFNGDINNLRVAYIAEDGKIEDMGAIIDGEYIAFITHHFSIYTIVEVVPEIKNEEALDLTWLWILLIALAAVIILLIIIIIIVKKTRKGGNAPKAPKTDDTPKPDPEAPAAEESAVEEASEEAPPAEEASEPTPEEISEEPAEEPQPDSETAEESTEEKAEEPEKPSIVILDEIPKDDAAVPVTEQVVRARYRSSFMSRLIQSESPIQDYYTTLKNALLSYKGVKARMSWNFESFNNGRTQCAKLNVKGRSFLVYLALNLDNYNANKYHFTDASDKPKFENVPMMLKVKSDRSLKYALELIDEVMKLNGFEKLKNFSEVDYHMPYETVAALAEKDLVKLILPAGVKLGEGVRLVLDDVGAIIDEANANAEKNKSEK